MIQVFPISTLQNNALDLYRQCEPWSLLGQIEGASQLHLSNGSERALSKSRHEPIYAATSPVRTICGKLLLQTDRGIQTGPIYREDNVPSSQMRGLKV